VGLIWISWQNIRRRKSRTFLLAFSLIVGITLLVTLLSVAKALRDDIDVMLDEYGANIIITPKPKTLPLSYGNITIPGFSDQPEELPMSDIKKIKTIKNRETINIIAPKLLVPAKIEGRKFLLVGVKFKEEIALKKWWKLNGKKPSRPEEIILGSKVAARLGKKVGDNLELKGERFKVAALLKRIGSQEDDLLYADLGKVQKLYHKEGKLSLIEVAAWCQTCPIERVVAQIGAKMPWTKVTAFKEVVASKANTLKIIDRFTLAILVVVLLIGALAVMATMMASVNERIVEIGVFRAIGYRQIKVMKIILFEVFLICLTSGIFGWLAGIGVAKIITPYLTGPRVSVSWNPALAGIAISLAIFVGVVAGYYPARKAANFEPQEALRAI
jgi:putative ABC transport system permease protein